MLNQQGGRLREWEVRTYISEPQRGRRRWKDDPQAQAAVYGNRRRIAGEHRKALLWRRGVLLDHSFAHAYETGGVTAASPSSLPQSSTGRLEVRMVLACS